MNIAHPHVGTTGDEAELVAFVFVALVLALIAVAFYIVRR